MALILIADGFAGNGRTRCATAAGVLFSESGGRTDARCYNYRSGITGKMTCSATPRADATSVDRGIYQINSRWHPEVTDAMAFDPVLAVREARRISGGFRSWTPWVGYTSGNYRKFLTVAGQSWDAMHGDKDKTRKVAATIGTSTTAGEVLGDPGGVVTAVTGATDAAAALPEFLGKLMDGVTWLRVVQVGAGLGAVLLGVLLLSNDLKGQALATLTNTGKGTALGAAAAKTAAAAL